MNKKILVVAVHPDDETLGAGGTLLRHIDEGDAVYWLTITNTDEKYGHPDELSQNRRKELKLVHKAYGFKESIHLDFAAAQLDEYTKTELISSISSVFKKMEPNIVYIQHRGDAHSEHKDVFDAVYSCTKSFRYPFVKEVYAMETLSETEFSAPLVMNAFIPNYFVDISTYLEKKLDIIKIYQSELGEHPFPRSIRNIRALATLRGAQAGVDSAEAFMCLKFIR
jgi:LmbE family N-acetylglucosaminyl deacetylase